MNLWNDAETFSTLDLTVAGAYRYATHPTTELLLVSWAIDGGPVQEWSPAEREPIPAELLAAYLNADTRTAHNSAFDRNVIPRCLRRMGIISDVEEAWLLNPRGWRCTMVKALTHALPADLDTLGKVLGLPVDQAKLADGKKLISRFCKPAPSNHKADRYDHTTHPELWGKFKQYAHNDVVAMRECDRRMPDWNLRSRELELWFLDQKINDRGFYADRALVDAAVTATDQEKAILAHRFVELTGGTVAKPSQRAQFQQFMVVKHGINLENTQKGTLLAAQSQLPPDSEAHELLEIALQSNKSSTSKYARIQGAIGEDSRFRGGLQFAGAGRTRRWGGRGFQPQNLPSRGLPKAEQVDVYIDAVKAGIHTSVFDKLMWYGSAALRGVVTAPKGRHIVAADLSNIEGRILAWVAAENWKVQAFRDYDAGTGPDLYNVTANMITGVDPWNVPKSMRNAFGKVPDLACFSADTLVLTDRGTKRIVDVQLGDRVWDGVEWVNHRGVIARGVRSVVSVAGIEVTPDHLINTQGTWLPAKALATCEKTLSRALATGSANLPWSASSEAQGAAFAASKLSVLAGALRRLWSRTSTAARRLGATSAQGAKLLIHQKCIGAMPTWLQMTGIGAGYSTGSHRVSRDAETQTTPLTRTMAVEASQCFRRGSPTEASSSGTSSLSRAGTFQRWSWIGLTSTKGMNPETCASSRSRRTDATSEPSPVCKAASLNSRPVFDLALAGPRSRFTVVSAAGFLLVHNCGYQGGVSGFQTFARAYNIQMADYWDTIQQSVDAAHITKARSNLRKAWARAQVTSLGISELEWLASETCKLAWRARHPATVGFWYALQDAAIRAIDFPGSTHEVTRLKISCRDHAGHKWLQILLPSGNRLCYFHPQVLRTVTVDEDTGKERTNVAITYWALASEDNGPRIWSRAFTHGGKLTGNVCQTLARDLLGYNLPSIEDAGYDIVTTVHDEVVAEADETMDEALMVQLLATNPPWADGLPLAAAGFSAPRYKKED